MTRSRPTKRPAAGRTRKPEAAPAEPMPPKLAPATPAIASPEELRAMLLAKRSELIAKLREEREGRREGGQREKIEGSPFGDRPGLSPDDEMGFAVADRRAEMLAQIDLALKKLDEGHYGRCEVCEEPINPLRLRAHPFAVRCTRCQEAWEREQSRPDTGAARQRTVGSGADEA
jgi:DnaK suppressor protein